MAYSRKRYNKPSGFSDIMEILEPYGDTPITVESLRQQVAARGNITSWPTIMAYLSKLKDEGMVEIIVSGNMKLVKKVKKNEHVQDDKSRDVG
jgi:DNA-binding transcriptional ArsR family regulator